MTIPSTGPISAAALRSEFDAGGSSVPINQLYAGLKVPAGMTGIAGAIPTQGMISYNSFRSSYFPKLQTGSKWFCRTWPANTFNGSAVGLEKIGEESALLITLEVGYGRVYKTTDAGATWALLGNAFTGVTVAYGKVYQKEGRLFILEGATNSAGAGTVAIWRSVDQGASWVKVWSTASVPLTAGYVLTLNSIVYGSFGLQVEYIQSRNTSSVTTNQSGQAIGVSDQYKDLCVMFSSDGGTTWSSSVLHSYHYNSVTVQGYSPTVTITGLLPVATPYVVFENVVSAFGKFYKLESGRVFVSLDGYVWTVQIGPYFTGVEQSTPANGYLRLLNNILYVVTTKHSLTGWRTIDGTTWELYTWKTNAEIYSPGTPPMDASSNLLSAGSMLVHVANPSTGLFYPTMYSADGGNTWSGGQVTPWAASTSTPFFCVFPNLIFCYINNTATAVLYY